MSETPHWSPQPGPQTKLLLTDADEILMGGARGGGKTAGGIMWLMKGNYKLPADHACYSTALNHPRYRALVVRREAQDLREWVDEAWELFKHTGAKASGKPIMFYWPTGAKIYTDHLNDENAYNKYRGWNINRILIEELSEIPKAKWYLRLFGSLRSKVEGDGLTIVPSQMLSTTNPDGAGHSWIKARFVSMTGNGGKPIPPNTMVRDPVTNKTRIFIPATLEDNKFLGPEYEGQILMQRAESEATFQAWRYGRWDVFEGAFFGECRFDGPLPGDPIGANANHTYDAGDVDLAPYWPRAIGVDWGFQHEAAVYWGCHNQVDKRMYVYREKVVRKVGSRQLGADIAQLTIPDIGGLPDRHIPLFLSADAFSKEDATRTKAELFMEGIRDVLGPNSVWIAEFTDSEKKMDPKDALQSMEERYISLSRGNCITVHRARQDRAAMADYVRDLLHWRPRPKAETDLDYARSLLKHENGMELYERYMDKFRVKAEPILPKVKFERSCRRLKECITTLVYDPNNTEVPLKVDSTGENIPGDDPYDGFCHLAMGFRIIENRKPRNVFVSERLEWFHGKYGANIDPVLTQQVLHKAHEDYSLEDVPEGAISVDRLM